MELLKKHPEVYKWTVGEDETRFFNPKFLEAIKNGSDEALISIFQVVTYGVFRIPVFNEQFCDMFADEMTFLEENNYDSLKRANTMNNYGIILNKMGFSDLIDGIMEKIMKYNIYSFFFDSPESAQNSFKNKTVLQSALWGALQRTQNELQPLFLCPLCSKTFFFCLFVNANNLQLKGGPRS